MPAIPSALDIARDLVRMDTRNPPGREVECAHYLGDMLAGAGLEVSYHDFAPGRTSLVAVLRGEGNERERRRRRSRSASAGISTWCRLGAKEWSVDPFGAEIVDDRLYGRGSTDMKSGVAAFVHAAMKLAADGTQRRGGHRARDLRRGGDRLRGLLPSGEGWVRSVKWAPSSSPSRRRTIPVLGHKGALWLRVETEGVTAHGSMPERGVNAIYRAARAVTKLEDFDFNVKPHGLLGRATLNVGTIEGGQNLNSVPDRAAFTVDIRTLPEPGP